MKLAESILMELDREAQTTKGVLDRIPDGKLAWRPHPKSFSLGQLALHIASVPAGVTAIAMQDTAEVPNFTQPEAKSRQEVLDTFSKSLESAKGNLNKMDDARLAATLNFAFSHAIHHRGQLSVYLRMLDIPVPSIYGPSADDNPFA